MKEFEVTKTIVHPNASYVNNGVLLLNDIMLIKLTGPVRFNKYVSPVCLPDRLELYSGKLGFAFKLILMLSQLNGYCG